MQKSEISSFRWDTDWSRKKNVIKEPSLINNLSSSFLPRTKHFLWPISWFFSARFIKMMNLWTLTWSTIILSKFTAYIHLCRNKRFTLTYDFPVENKIFSSEKQHRKYFLYWTMIWKSPLSVYAFLIENSQSNFFRILF